MAQAPKAQRDEWDCIKLKKVLHSKENKQRKNENMEKISANHVSDKGLTTRIYKQLQ